MAEGVNPGGLTPSAGVVYVVAACGSVDLELRGVHDRAPV